MHENPKMSINWHLNFTIHEQHVEDDIGGTELWVVKSLPHARQKLDTHACTHWNWQNV